MSSRLIYIPHIEVSTLAGSGSVASNDGTGVSASFDYPSGNCVDYSGTYLYVNDGSSYPPRRVKLSSGEVTSILTNTVWNANFGLACDGSGGLFISSQSFQGIYYASLSDIQTSGSSATTVAGQVSSGSSDSSIGLSASFQDPWYISLDSSYSFLYIADSQNNLVRKMSTTSPYPVSSIASLFNVISVVVDSNYLYAIANGIVKIFRESLSSCTSSAKSISNVYAGTEQQGYMDGSLSLATFYSLYSLSIDSSSNLYIVDNNAIRLVSSVAVSTIAGLAHSSGYQDGNGSYSKFSSSGGFAGILPSSPSMIFVSDQVNNRIRSISCSTGYQLYFGACGEFLILSSLLPLNDDLKCLCLR